MLSSEEKSSLRVKKKTTKYKPGLKIASTQRVFCGVSVPVKNKIAKIKCLFCIKKEEREYAKPA